MNNQDSHERVLSNLEDHYVANGIQNEFLWDGPSNWERYERSTPRIVFLAKEAYDSFHHSTPSSVYQTKFSETVAEWASVIKSTLNCNPPYKDLQEAWNSIAIVEIKKIDDDKQQSNHNDLINFAWLGREHLKQQLDILDPHIIVCLGKYAIEYFDIIYNYTECSLEEMKQKERELYFNINCKCWLSNNFIVVQSYHASYWGKSKDELSNSIKNIFLDVGVQSVCCEMLNSK